MLVMILVKTVGSVVNELCTLGILHLERWQNIFQEVTGLINRPLQFISSFSRRESVAVLKKSAILSSFVEVPLANSGERSRYVCVLFAES
jgi:hypothetical protein